MPQAALRISDLVVFISTVACYEQKLHYQCVMVINVTFLLLPCGLMIIDKIITWKISLLVDCVST